MMKGMLILDDILDGWARNDKVYKHSEDNNGDVIECA
jgi:hypothetical protein